MSMLSTNFSKSESVAQALGGEHQSFSSKSDALLGASQLRILRDGVARLASRVRKESDQNAGVERVAHAADTWLMANIGQADDRARRAAIAALSLSLPPFEATLPADILALQPQMQEGIARFLASAHAYDDSLFAKDLMLASGGAVLSGSFMISLPRPTATLFNSHARRALGAAYRQSWQFGPSQALRWLVESGLSPWAEIHLDTRNLREFNAEGFERSYRRAAALMRIRPELAGIYGASWLYDPQLKDVSPNLAFIRDGAVAGGGRLVRLRTDAAQVGFAVAHSPSRRRLFERGLYKPVCYGMYWSRRALIAWAAQKVVAEQKSESSAKRRRSS